MKKSRESSDINKLIHQIRSHSDRNVGNILNPQLFKKTYLSNKKLIEEYFTVNNINNFLKYKLINLFYPFILFYLLCFEYLKKKKKKIIYSLFYIN